MNKLNELIHKLCPDGVPFCELSEVLTIKNGKDYKGFDEGDIPVYGSGGIMTYIDTSAYDKPSVLIPRKGSLDKLYYVDTPFWNVDTVFYTEIDENIVIPKYVFYCLQKQHLERLNKAGGVPSLTQSVLNKVVVPVPPIEVQSEIVRILDNFTELTAELAARLATELTAKKKQYEYYRDQLLSFACDVPQVKLGDYFPHIRNGFVGTATPYFTTKDNGIRYLKGTNIHDGTISDNDFCYITPEFHQKHIRNELKLNDILMVQSGHVGECAVVTEQYVGANCHALIIMSNGGNCNSKYVVHYLHTTEGKKKLAAITTGGTVKHILASEMKKFTIPLPSLDEQDRIVDILDRLDTHCNDLVSNLTVEVEARQKQYEYYRDKLLTFEECKENVG